MSLYANCQRKYLCDNSGSKQQGSLAGAAGTREAVPTSRFQTPNLEGKLTWNVGSPPAPFLIESSPSTCLLSETISTCASEHIDWLLASDNWKASDRKAHLDIGWSWHLKAFSTPHCQPSCPSCIVCFSIHRSCRLKLCPSDPCSKALQSKGNACLSFPGARGPWLSPLSPLSPWQTRGVLATLQNGLEILEPSGAKRKCVVFVFFFLFVLAS